MKKKKKKKGKQGNKEKKSHQTKSCLSHFSQFCIWDNRKTGSTIWLPAFHQGNKSLVYTKQVFAGLYSQISSFPEEKSVPAEESIHPWHEVVFCIIQEKLSYELNRQRENH